MNRLASALLLAGCLVATPVLAALKLGNPAPDFTAQAAVGGQVFSFSLAEALKKGPVVLYFFPKAFTTGCTAEAHDFAEASGRFAAAGATLIGMSADGIETLQRFSTQECSAKFPVAADPDLKVIRAYDSTGGAQHRRRHRRTRVLRDRAGRHDRLRLSRQQSRQARREHAGGARPVEAEAGRLRAGPTIRRRPSNSTRPAPHRIELWTIPLPRGCSTTDLELPKLVLDGESDLIHPERLTHRLHAFLVRRPHPPADQAAIDHQVVAVDEGRIRRTRGRPRRGRCRR